MSDPGWTFLGAMKEEGSNHPSYYFKSAGLPDVAVRVKKIEGGAGMSISTTKPPASEDLTHKADDKEVADAEMAATKILRTIAGVQAPSSDQRKTEESRAAEEFDKRKEAEGSLRFGKPPVKPFGGVSGEAGARGTLGSAPATTADSGGLAGI